MAREEGWHHETFVPDPVYRVRDFFNSWEITSNELKALRSGFFLDGTHFL